MFVNFLIRAKLKLYALIANLIITVELSRLIYVFLVLRIVLTILNSTFSVYNYGLVITNIPM